MPKGKKNKKELANIIRRLRKDKRVDTGIIILFVLSLLLTPNLLFLTIILMWFFASWKKDVKKLVTIAFLAPILSLLLGSYLGSFYTLDTDTSIGLLNIITFWGSWILLLTFVGGISARLFKKRLGLKYDNRKILLVTFWLLVIEMSILLFSFMYSYDALGYYDSPPQVQINLNE